MHKESTKIVLADLFTEKKGRHRHREQTCGNRGEGKDRTNWGSSSNILYIYVCVCVCTIMFETDSWQGDVVSRELSLAMLWPREDGLVERLKRGSVQFSSVVQLCSALRDPTDCSTPGLPVHHQLSEPAPTHLHQVGDAIQPSHPLSSPSPPAPNPSQHQGLHKRWPKYWSFRFSSSPSSD